jgi:hypothetical protein
VPTIAVTVTVNVDWTKEMTVKVDEPDPPCDIVTPVGFRETVRPGATVVPRITVPEKPLTPVILIVEFTGNPASAMINC